MNLGPQTPLGLSLTAGRERAKMQKDVQALAQELRGGGGVTLLVGGAQVEAMGIRAAGNVHVMKSMSELAAFARGEASAKVAVGGSRVV